MRYRYRECSPPTPSSQSINQPTNRPRGVGRGIELRQMRQIDCSHEAGVSATVAAELVGMVSPRTPWVLREAEDGADETEAAGGRVAGGGLSAVLQDGGGVSVWEGGDGVAGGWAIRVALLVQHTVYEVYIYILFFG